MKKGTILLGTIIATVAPIAAVVSCSENDKKYSSHRGGYHYGTYHYGSYHSSSHHYGESHVSTHGVVVHTGPRGGVWHYNSNGHKSYYHGTHGNEYWR